MNAYTIPDEQMRRGWSPVLVSAGVLLVLAATTSALLVLGRPRGQSAEAAPPQASANVSAQRALACVGYIDVPSGVLAVNPTVSGRVRDVSVQANQRVGAGAVLFRLEDESARADVQQADQNLRAAQARLNEAQKGPELHKSLVAQEQAAVEAALRDLDAGRLIAKRKQKLAESQNLSSEEAEAAQQQVRKLQAALQAEREKLHAAQLPDPQQEVIRAQANVAASEALVDKAQQALRQYTVKAPVTGQILRVHTQKGDLVGPQSPQPVALLVPDEPRIVRAEVRQEFAQRVALGQPVDVADDTTIESPRWQGRVSRLADWFGPQRIHPPDATPAVDVRTLECIVQLELTQPSPRIGQRVRVIFYER